MGDASDFIERHGEITKKPKRHHRGEEAVRASREGKSFETGVRERGKASETQKKHQIEDALVKGGRKTQSVSEALSTETPQERAVWDEWRTNKPKGLRQQVNQDRLDASGRLHPTLSKKAAATASKKSKKEKNVVREMTGADRVPPLRDKSFRG